MQQPIARLADWLAGLGRLGADAQGKLILSLAVLLVLSGIRWLAVRAYERRAVEPTAAFRWRKGTLYLTAVLSVLLLAVIWFREVRSLATFLGLLTAGLAIALRDLVTGFAGWLFILARKPFDIGDRIQVGAYSGDVIDLRIFKFTLMEIGNWVDADQSTGRVVHIPNSDVLSQVVVNYSRGFEFIWNELPVLVTFESDWRRAKQILLEVVQSATEGVPERAQQSLRNASKRFLLYYSQLTPTVYTSVKDSGVMLTIRHLCEPRKRRGTSQAIWEEILTRFAAEPEIDFAYPTQRFYDNLREGKTAPK